MERLNPAQPRALIGHWAGQSGDRIAIWGQDGRKWTYAELQDRTRAAQFALEKAGVRRGDRIAIGLPNSFEFIEWLMGVVQLGAVAVPHDPRLPYRDVCGLIDSASCDYRIADEGVEFHPLLWSAVTVCDSHNVKVLRRVKPILGKGLGENLSVLVQFSSGSSGERKRILRSEAQLFEDYRHFVEALELGFPERHMGVAPFYHAYGALGLWATLSVGGTVMPVRSFMPSTFLKSALSFHPTLLLMTPAMVEALGKCRLASEQATAFASARHVVCSTGPLSEDAHRDFREKYGAPPKILYGSTETLSATVVRGGTYKLGNVGAPLPGVELAIFDDDGNPVAVGEAGKVGIKSAAACRGYEGELVEERALRMIGEFVLPGDRGYIDKEGELFLIGRDDVINIGGYKVNPIELETIVRSAFRISYMKVVPYSRGGALSLHAIIESSDERISPRGVMEVCKISLPIYKVPSRVDILRIVPRDENGKVNLGRLKEAVGGYCHDDELQSGRRPEN